MVWGGRTRWVEVRSRHSVPGTWGRRGFAEGWPVGLGNEGTELGRPRGCGLSRKLQGAGVGRSPPELSSRREHGVCHGPVPPERPVTSVLAAHAPPCGGGAEPFCSAFARPRLARRAGLSIPGAEGSGATGGTPGERPPLSPEASPALPCCFQQVPVLDSSRLPAPARLRAPRRDGAVIVSRESLSIFSQGTAKPPSLPAPPPPALCGSQASTLLLVHSGQQRLDGPGFAASTSHGCPRTHSAHRALRERGPHTPSCSRGLPHRCPPPPPPQPPAPSLPPGRPEPLTSHPRGPGVQSRRE